MHFPRPVTGVLTLHSEKTPSAGTSVFGWLSNFRGLSDDYILNHHSLDAYLYVRFLKMLTLMAFVGALITWPVLFPVNATGGGGESGRRSTSSVENLVITKTVAWKVEAPQRDSDSTHEQNARLPRTVC